MFDLSDWNCKVTDRGTHRDDRGYSGYVGYPRIRRGDRVRHGDIEGTVCDIIPTSVGTQLFDIVDAGGRFYRCYAPDRISAADAA